ncbi:MAG: hypothetical protein KJ726_06020 [Verrucomicrobia bacterium]|nr:hypothetical protein [Verrucomicrobiota bacterium]
MKNGRSILWAVLAAASLAVMYGPSLLEHARLARDPYLFNDDIRHWLVPFAREAQPGIRPDDYLVNYRQAMTPIGQRLFYRWSARLFDPAVTSKALPLVQYALLVAVMGWCAVRLGGWVCGWATLALALSSHEFLYRMVGGTARSWAFPLAALAAAALLGGSIRGLALLTILAAAFYPPMALVFGLTLLGAILPARIRRVEKAVVLLLTVLLSAACLWPNTTREYGRRLGPADVSAYPELGPGGRYGFDDRPPFLNVGAAVADAFGRSLQGGDPAWIPTLRNRIMAGSTYGRPAILLVVIAGFFGLLTLGGSVLLARREAPVRRLLILFGASCVAYLAAAWLSPALYFPQRYVIYTVPVLTLILLPATIRQLAGRLHPTAASGLVIVTTLACLALLGGHGGGSIGLSVDAHAERELYQRLATLPPDSLIAGWPQGVMNNVPWLCRRSVLLNWESHEAIHQRYADEMRRRMNALVAAYFATSLEPLARLRAEWGVTHLLVQLSHYKEVPPVYFEPFSSEIEAAHAALRERGSEVRRQADRCAVYRDEDFVLLDLTRLNAQ